MSFMRGISVVIVSASVSFMVCTFSSTQCRPISEKPVYTTSSENKEFVLMSQVLSNISRYNTTDQASEYFLHLIHPSQVEVARTRLRILQENALKVVKDQQGTMRNNLIEAFLIVNVYNQDIPVEQMWAETLVLLNATGEDETRMSPQQMYNKHEHVRRSNFSPPTQKALTLK